jgi:hypothetical protein
MTSFQPTRHGQANSDVTYPCSRPLHAHHRIEELRQLLDETRTEFQALLGPVLDNLQQRLDGIEGGAK